MDCRADHEDTNSHAYAAYLQDLAAADVTSARDVAPANVDYARDTAQAGADYHLTMTGISRDMSIAWAQLRVARVNAADPSTFSCIYPQAGGLFVRLSRTSVSRANCG